MTQKRSRLPGWMPGATSARGTSDRGLGPRAIPAWVRSLLLRPTAPSLVWGIVVAASFIVIETLAVLLLKQLDPQEAFETLYLLGVVVVSTVWGLGVAVTTSVTSAIALAYFRNWPATHSVSFNLENGVVIVVFLVVALLTNFVAGLARARAVEADQRRREASVLAELQASLRRVATLVARAVSPSEVFSAVAGELARYLGVYHHAVLFRYEPNGTGVLLAVGQGNPRDAAADEALPAAVVEELTKRYLGERFSLEGESVVAKVFRTGCAARMDSYQNAPGSVAARFRGVGIRTSVGAPIIVEGRLWGAAIVGSSRPEPLPPDTEAQVGDFADLVATAIANAETRAQLTASRARIVAAGDDARRRFERDLHDGAQQRLVSIGLAVRTAEASVPPDLHPLKEQISGIVTALDRVSEEVQEISRGIHPPILSRGGLGPALQALARRSTVPVELDVGVEGRLPESVEVAAYYVVAEALTNAAKHARASAVKVSVEAEGANLRLSIRDDGIGGADVANGSGLIGLIDRVEALGGTMHISSHAGSGTSLLVKIPLDTQ
jgi:signal transduction histidine kinase